MKRIGRYEVQAEIGRGGFGRVVRAHDPIVGRAVAIKTLTAAGEPELLMRFRNEAGATGKLRHPNIIVVYDFGEQDGTPYIVMELLEGEDLERILSSGRRLKVLESVNVMTQVGAGLQHAHINGIIHRDVKPANIMLLGNGTVKIMDFGIALLMLPTEARLTPQGSLIGTFPYMAPEQFYGTASDALTDIFAYGATFYKLLTGTHPFQAPEMAGVMFNIVNKAPRPLRELNPECPEALEEAIFKALSKDRESRYQSFDDVLFDLEPVVVELRKEHTLVLIAEARQQIAAEQFDEAQGLIRQALNIDPANRTLRELRERLQREIKERNLRPRVAALVDQGREQLRARQYNEAIQRFESALRLDNSSTEIHGLIAEARAAWERAQRSERLVKEAYRAFDAGDLTAAYKSITDALSIVPDDRRASGLLENISSQIESRNRQRRLSEGLNQAKGLILLQNFDDSIPMLTALQLEYPESSELQELLARAVQERAALLRAQRLQAEVRAVKDLLKEGIFSEAIDKVSTLLEEFPDSAELSDLGSYARGELRAQQQAEAITRVTAEVKVLLGSGKLDTAIERIRYALVEYPTASALREALQSAISAKAEHERSTALEATAEEVRRLLANTRFHESLERIASFTDTYGEAATLDSLRRSATDGLQKQRRIRAILSVLSQGQNLIDEGRPSTASELLEQATIEFPGDPNLSKLLGLARDKVHEREQAEAIAKLVEEAETFARSGQFQEALDVMGTGLRQYPGNTRLLRCNEAILAQRVRQERERRRKEAIDEVTQLRLQEAAEAIQDVVRTFGEDQETVALTRSVSEAAAKLAREQEISGAVEQAQGQLDEGNPSLATQVLRDALAKYPEASQLRTLLAVAERRDREQQEALAREQEISAAVEQAQGQLDEGNLSLAIQILQDAVAKYPEATQLRTLLTVAESREREQQEALACEQEIRGAVEQAQAQLDEGNLSLAIQILQDAVAKYPEASQLRTLLAVAERREREQQEALAREQEISGALERAQGQLDEGNLSLATEVLQNALAKYPEASQLKTLLAVAERRERGQQQALAREQEISAAVEQAQARLDEGNPSLAIQVLRGALAKYPEATQLRTSLAVAEAREREQKRAKDVESIVAAARQHLEKEQFGDALKKLDKGLKTYPGRKEIEDQRTQTLAAKQAHERREGVAAALREVRELRRAGELEAALKASHSAIERYEQEPELVELRNELADQLEAGRRAEHRRITIQQIHALLAQREAREAEKLTQLAIAEYGQDAELAGLLAEANQAIANALKEEEIERGIAQTLALAEARHFERAHAVLDEAIARHPDYGPLLLLREDILARQARLQLYEHARELHASKNFPQALEAVELGLRQTPKDAEWLALKAQIERDQQQQLRVEAMRKAIQSVEALLREERYQEGQALLDEAVRKWGPSEGAAALYDRVQRHVEAQRKIEARKLDLEKLSAIHQGLRLETSKRELKAFDRQAERIAAAYAQDEDFKQLVLEIRTRIGSLQPAPKPIPWKFIAALGAVVLLVAGTVVFAVRLLHRPGPAAIALKIQADPAGAIIRIGGQSCATPICSFQLPPGEYQISASHAGYRDVKETVKLAADQPAPVVNLTLDPAVPPTAAPVDAKTGTLTVRTGIPKALVTVDGVPRGRTDQQGSFQVSLEAAAHDVQVGKEGYETPAARQVRVAQGSAETVAFNMTEQNARLEPGGAPVTQLPAAAAAQQPPVQSPIQAPAQSPVQTTDQQDWERVRTTSSRADLAAFLNSHANSPHAAEASARLDDLNWSSVNRADEQSLEAFLHQSPGSSHGSEAQTLLAQLQQQKLQTQPKTEPQKTESPKLEAAPTLPRQDTQTQAIDTALDQFNSAFQDKQPRELKKVWPGVPDETAKAMRLPGTIYVMTLRPLADPRIANGGASILCELTTRITLRGQVTSKQRQVQVLLQNNSGTWLITNPFGSVP